jgi:very-short-patch-repair endonuclease
VSKGSEELLVFVKELYPNQRIELEHNVADRGGLYIDIFLPRLKLAFEFDGEQHFEYIEHFHGSRYNFLRAKKRDEEKDVLCRTKGITLIRVAYNEDMTKTLIHDKIDEALNE